MAWAQPSHPLRHERRWGGEMAQLLKCLPSIREHMSSVLRTQVGELGVAAHACNLAARERETEETLRFAVQSAYL